jgi:hypothetical protein
VAHATSTGGMRLDEVDVAAAGPRG